MFSSLETIAIIAIIITQLVIAYHAFKQIMQTKSFLPGGRDSLTLKEYEIPSDKILELEPSQVVDKITYLVKKDSQKEDSVEQPRDDKGGSASRTVYSPLYGDIEAADLDQ